MRQKSAGQKHLAERDMHRTEAVRQQVHRYDEATDIAARAGGMSYVRVPVPSCTVTLESFKAASYGANQERANLDRWRRDKTPVSHELTLPAMDYGK